jgi:glycosyltransferase involved in cell wall biosynthesis
MVINKPKVSIGMPIYNAGRYLKGSLDSLISQSFIDFELIISDNASTDNTRDICLEYSEKDHRIRYIRQTENIGPWLNFKYVLDQSQAEYFMWAAHDDVKSIDFIELNYNFLSVNQDHVASTCPNQFEAKHQDISFSMKESSDFKRYMKFFDYCWFSHGIFYSLIRRNILKQCALMDESISFFGIDWGVDIFLASKGKINLTDKGYSFFYDGGASTLPNHHKLVKRHYLEYVIPLYKLGAYVISLTNNLSLIKRARIILILLRLNFKVIYGRIRAQVKILFIYLNLIQDERYIK